MQKVINYLTKILKPNDKVVVGVSGGSDSMCLLFILNTLKKKINFELIAVHINHNVRVESEEEKDFVINTCQKNNIIYEYLKIEEYEKGNFEAVARKKRYQFYLDILGKYNASFLMTAHHGDDLTETILMRMVRGSNIKGYVGIPLESDFKGFKLIRPLLFVTKEDIEKYNERNNVEYRVDQTNFDLTYTRNRIRHTMLPILKKENQNVHQKFLEFSENMQEINAFLENIIKNALTNTYSFGKVNVLLFNKLEHIVKKGILEVILKNEYGNDVNSINSHHVELMINMLNSKKANQVLMLPKRKKFIKCYNEAYFEEKKVEQEYFLEELDDYVKINKQEYIQKIDTCDIAKSNFILRLDSKEIKLPLCVRYRTDGDSIKVKNLHGHKKIKDILINEKIPLEKRDTIPIVVDGNNEVLWIPGIKKSEFDKNIDEFYDIIYKYVKSEEIKNENE